MSSSSSYSKSMDGDLLLQAGWLRPLPPAHPARASCHRAALAEKCPQTYAHNARGFPLLAMSAGPDTEESPGWLLLERWLVGDETVQTACCGAVPGPFNGSDAADERSLTQFLSRRDQLAQLARFRDAWITRADV